MSKEIVAMLLAGGQGSRLHSLTQRIAKPAIPFGGKYRIIDFPLSNCVNSGIDTVGVLTQYQPYVLNEYIGNGQPWDLDRLYGGVHVLSPYQKMSGNDWYKGTANAIYQNIDFIDRYDPQYVIILSGDTISRQDYREMIEFHKESGADCTIAVMEVPKEDSWRYGMVEIDENCIVAGFEEKPAIPKSNLASMGLYIFNWEVLRAYLIADENNTSSTNDFGKDIFPEMLADERRIAAFRFDGYWKDVGTIDTLWETNMEALDPERGLNLFDNDWRIYSRNSGLPGHRISGDAIVENSMITDGCRIKGTIRHSVLSAGVKVGEGAVVEDSVIMDGTVIKAGAYIINAVVGENVTIGESAVIGARTEGKPVITTVGHNVIVADGQQVAPGAILNEFDNNGEGVGEC